MNHDMDVDKQQKKNGRIDYPIKKTLIHLSSEVQLKIQKIIILCGRLEETDKTFMNEL